MKKVIFDWKRTLYDPDNKTLVDGTLDLLNFLKRKHIQIVLIGKGNDDMYSEVERLGIKNYFTNIMFSEGVKDLNLFTPYIHKKSPQDTLFIGDRVRSELAIGSNLGATTLWVKQGKFAAEEPESEDQTPTYTVKALSEVKQVLEKILG